MPSPVGEAALLNFDQLLKAARAGSREARGQLFESFRRLLFRRASRVLRPSLRPKGEAADLVQMTLLEAEVGFPQFRGTCPEELRAWLCRILDNNLKNFHRQYFGTRKRQVAVEVSLERGLTHQQRETILSADESPSSEAVHSELTRQVQHALLQLSEHYQVVIRLHTTEDHSFKHIGKLLNSTAEAVRKLWHRAVVQLAELTTMQR